MGLESGNPTITAGRELPWLQAETGAPDPWRQWPVSYRDVLILDGDNVPAVRYNLTEHDLGVDDNLAELKGLLLQVEAEL